MATKRGTGIDVIEAFRQGEREDALLQKALQGLEGSKVDLTLAGGNQPLQLGSSIDSNTAIMDRLTNMFGKGDPEQQRKAEQIMRSTVSTGQRITAPGRIRNRV